MIVVDASTALSALLKEGPARRVLAAEQLHAPHLLDSEVANALRRHVSGGHVTSVDGLAALQALQRLGLTRYPGLPLATRVWELRDNLSAYDATYVALAELLGCALVTADHELSGAPALRYSVTVLPR